MELVIPYHDAAIDIVTRANGDLAINFSHTSNFHTTLTRQLLNDAELEDVLSAFSQDELERTIEIIRRDYELL